MTHLHLLDLNMIEISEVRNRNILVVGDVMLDRYWWGSVNRISPEAPVPVIRLERTSGTPGGAANVAANVAALGAGVILVGLVGSDPDADELRHALIASNVSPDNLHVLNSKRTIVKTRIVAHNQQVARIDVEDAAEIDEIESKMVCRLLSGLIPKVDAIIISDYAKGFVTAEIISFLIQAGSQAGKSVLVDPKGNDFSKYAGASILTPNRFEAAAACNLDELNPDTVRASGTRLLNDLGLQAVLITEGENGMTLFGSDGSFHVDSAAHQVFDVTGAGDTVIATLGVAVAAGFDLHTAVRLANDAAGIAVGKVGTAVIELAMLNSIGTSTQVDRLSTTR